MTFTFLVFFVRPFFTVTLPVVVMMVIFLIPDALVYAVPKDLGVNQKNRKVASGSLSFWLWHDRIMGKKEAQLWEK